MSPIKKTVFIGLIKAVKISFFGLNVTPDLNTRLWRLLVVDIKTDTESTSVWKQ